MAQQPNVSWNLLPASFRNGRTTGADSRRFPLPGATGVGHPSAVPNAAPAAQTNNGTLAQPPQPEEPATADDQSSVFVFKKEVQEVILHATVIDEQRNLVTNLDRARIYRI